ncbi:MAG: 30S ribosomal protein S20 [Ruminococcaceae bacterium]|nr:30S ribosomal protein S20 [Oscillospiraceae bacterium]
MPNIKSQIKRVGTDKKKTTQNKAIKSNLRTVLKRADVLLADENADKAALVNETYSAIDKAASKGVIHKNTAARKKSLIAKKAGL